MNIYIEGQLVQMSFKRGKATKEELAIIEENIELSSLVIQEQLMPDRSINFIERQMADIKRKFEAPKEKKNKRPNHAPIAIKKNDKIIGSVMTSGASSMMDDNAKNYPVTKNVKYQDCITRIYDEE